MEMGVTVVAGTILRFVFDAIKNNLGLSGKSAAWGTMGLSLLAAFGINLGFGNFAGIDFNVANPGEALAALGTAWGTVYGTAAAWYSVTKKNSPSSKK